MRREAAKRKLENQQKRRAERARRRQRTAIITSASVVVVVVVAVVLFSTVGMPGGDDGAAPADAPTPTAAPAEPAALGDCTFTPTPDEPAAKPAPVPTVTTASTSGTVAVSLQTNQGAIPLTLDRATGPCAVESFVSLVNAGYYNDTPCHRLTTGEGLRVLQCGDPSG